MTALHVHLADLLAKRKAAEDAHLTQLERSRGMAATQRQLTANAAKPGTIPGTATVPNPPKGSGK